MTEHYLEPYKAEYLLATQLEKVQFEKGRMERQLASANKRLHMLWTDIWLYVGMLVADIIIMGLAWLLARLGNLPIRLLTVPVALICLVLLFIMGPLVLYRLSKSIILYMINFKGDRYVRFLHKYDIVTYAAEASKCQRVLTRYHTYMEELEQQLIYCRNGSFQETQEQLEERFEQMDLDQKVKIASPFSGKMNRIAKAITIAAYIFIIILYLLYKFL